MEKKKTLAKWWGSSSKVLWRYRNIRNKLAKQELLESKLLELWKSQKFTVTKKMMNQEKGNLKTIRNCCDIFICPCLTLSQNQLQSWRWQSVFLVWDFGLWFQWEQSRPYSQIIVNICSNLSGGDHFCYA